MAEFPAGQERLLKQLISTYRCHVCRRTFERDHVRLAARHEQLWIVSVRCTLCRNQQVFWIALKHDEGESILRDVTRPEDDQVATAPPVTSDDVLDMHEFLREFNGDFERLFST
ncbi:MAG TPA: hypothetical protein VF221_04590 [Chloroflexota bacterium]